MCNVSVRDSKQVLKALMLGVALDWIYVHFAIAAGCIAPSLPVGRAYPPAAITELSHREQSEAAVIGDSIAQRWGSVDLQRLFHEDVQNLGYSGDTPWNVLWRLHKIKTPPVWRRVLLIVGVNAAWLDPKCHTVAAAVEADVVEVKHLAPRARVYVLSVLPFQDGLSSSLPMIASIDHKLQADSGPLKYSYIDPVHDFLAVCQDKKSCPLLDGWLHPTELGYAVIANAVRNSPDWPAPAKIPSSRP